MTRTEAIGLRLSRYNTGKPCKRGHLADRYTKNGGCVNCVNPKFEITDRLPPITPTVNSMVKICVILRPENLPAVQTLILTLCQSVEPRLGLRHVLTGAAPKPTTDERQLYAFKIIPKFKQIVLDMLQEGW